jgi:hypothetical protein
VTSPITKPASQQDDLCAPPVSTQSIVKDGTRIAVRDSDSDDSLSLVSLDDLLGRAKEDDETSASSPPDEDDRLEKERQNTLRLFTSGRSDALIGKDKLRSILASSRTNKTTINKFLSDQSAHIAAKEDMKAFDETEEGPSLRPDETATRSDLISALRSYTDATEEDAAKLVGAISRTDALSQETCFYFFRPDAYVRFKRKQGDHPFPEAGVPLRLFRCYDDRLRNDTFLSGYMAELALAGKLSPSAMRWIFMSLPHERDETLRCAYIRCLGKGAASWAPTGLKPVDVRNCFGTLGARPSSREMSSPIEAVRRLYDQPRTPSTMLVSILDTFVDLCPYMSFESLSQLASIVCRLTIDASLVSQAPIADRVESLFDRLLGANSDSELAPALHVAEHIVTDMTTNLQDPSLQALLLEHIPPMSLLQCHVRIQLAHNFLLGVTGRSDRWSASAPPTIDLSALTNLVNTSDDFATARRRTKLNYTDLRARVTILDIAISDGGRPENFPSALYARARDFNDRVDAMAQAVRKAYTAIADTGATHMKRTEAKERLDCVYQRLHFLVRTEPPLKYNIFDQDSGKLVDAEEVRLKSRQREIMQTHFRSIATGQKAREKIKREVVGPTQTQQTPQSTPGLALKSSSSSEEPFVDAVEHLTPSGH